MLLWLKASYNIDMKKESPIFSTVAIMGRSNHPNVEQTLEKLTDILVQKNIKPVLDQKYAELLLPSSFPTLEDIPYSQIDLVVVIGGDGSLLESAREVVTYDIPIVGINRGRIGFLTDISPQDLDEILPILEGDYVEEPRFLLEAELQREGKTIHRGIALNDVVVYSGHVARMIEFEIFINKRFVYKQRSDGLITTTPTGSTAYALSGGGPIVHPHLEAITLVQMHPHTLSSRPIVINAQSTIELHLTQENQLHPRCSLDGQEHFDMVPNDIVKITRHTQTLRLLHPKQYDYYQTLRSKLGWGHSN